MTPSINGVLLLRLSTVIGKWSGPSELLQVIIHGECKGRWRRKNG